ncbi:MAG: hypothetical protein KJO87_05645, partial [Acidimicrobiia bacterium]|nr:hypothetical protein [Acidimicrobiia bacterium]
MILSACGTGDATTTTVPPLATTTTQPDATGSTTSTTSPSIPAGAVDWEAIRAARWLTHGIDGIWTDTGDFVWETDPILGGDNLARDGAGGFVWLDVAGVWWLPLDAPQPVLAVPDAASEIVEVIETNTGPVVRLGYFEASFFDLTTGESVAEPAGGEVGYHETGNVRWLAANGLEAVIEGPETELDAEGQPVRIVREARLIVRRGLDTIFESPAGTFYEPYARIHDFDGQRILTSRGPYEPALPEETFTMLDLACTQCAARFTSSATYAAFTDLDSAWDGIELAVQYRVLMAEPLGSDEVTSLTDGVYIGRLLPETVSVDSLAFDLGVWFSGEDANRAARDDGETEVPVPNDYYIRNRSDEIWTFTVSPDVVVTSVWYNAETAPDTSGVPIPYAELVQIMGDDADDVLANLRLDPWWVTIEDARIVR